MNAAMMKLWCVVLVLQLSSEFQPASAIGSPSEEQVNASGHRLDIHGDVPAHPLKSGAVATLRREAPLRQTAEPSSAAQVSVYLSDVGNVVATAASGEHVKAASKIDLEAQGDPVPSPGASSPAVDQHSEKDVEVAAIKMLITQKKESKMQAQALAFILIGMVIVVMTVIYLTNSSDAHLKGMTWRTLSDSIGLFIAILIFFTDKDLTTLLFQGEDGLKKEDKSKDGSAPDPGILFYSFARLVFNYILVMILLWKFKDKNKMLNSLGNLGGHVIAFTSADFFGLVQECPPFNASPGAAICVVPLVLLLGMTLRIVGCRQRKKATEAAIADGVDHECLHEWEHQCAHTEDEFLSFTAGLLISQFCRFNITGHLPPPYGYKKKKKFTLNQTMSLFGCAMAFGALVVICGYFRDRLGGGGNPTVHKVLASLQGVMSMSMAWCLHFWSKWFFYYYANLSGTLSTGIKMVGKVAMALIFSPVGFMGIVLCDSIADRCHQLSGLRAMNEGFVLLIGLAWEKTFMQAIDSIELDDSITQQAMQKAGLSLGLVVFVAPAWAWYILPKSVEALKAEHGHGHGDANDHGDGDAAATAEGEQKETDDGKAGLVNGAAPPAGEAAASAAPEQAAGSTTQENMDI